jgi:hypothetical protein
MRSNCSFTTCKLRVFAHFRLAIIALIEFLEVPFSLFLITDKSKRVRSPFAAPSTGVEGGTARQGGAQDARYPAAGPWMARLPDPTGAKRGRSRTSLCFAALVPPAHRREKRHGGGLSLRCFLWPRKESDSSCGGETPHSIWPWPYVLKTSRDLSCSMSTVKS